MAPAQKLFIERYLDWDRVEARLNRYPAIQQSFDLVFLRSFVDTPPWYCHYVAWILGAWTQEDETCRLNELLALGSEFDGWTHEFRTLKPRPGIGDYWSLVWQLEVAEFLTGLTADVRWHPGGGPDLSARRGSEHLYIECYCPTKAWGIECFLCDLVIKTDPSSACLECGICGRRSRAVLMQRSSPCWTGR
jgi:hypothetical protein